MTQQLDAGHNAVLAKGETANSVVASGTESSGTLVTLNNSRILWMVSAIQHRWFQARINYLGLVFVVLVRSATLFWLLFLLTATLVLFSRRWRALALTAN